MPKVTFAYLRQLNAAIIPWVMFALLLPVLLGILPAATPSAEAAFAHKLTQSICAPLGTSGHEAPKQHAADCILCATGCPVCGTTLDPETATLPARVKLAAAPFTHFTDLPITQSWRTRAHTPRAPPMPA